MNSGIQYSEDSEERANRLRVALQRLVSTCIRHHWAVPEGEPDAINEAMGMLRDDGNRQVKMSNIEIMAVVEVSYAGGAK